MACKVVKISNLSLSANEQDIKEFFSFSGEIEHFDIQSNNERSQTAHVTFKDPQGAETAILLSGATIVDQSVIIELSPDYISPSASAIFTSSESGPSVVQRAEDVVSTMLAKGFILGKDAVAKAKAFDEKLQLTSGVTSLDKRIGLTEKLSVGSSIVNDRFREVDAKFGVSSALAVAEQTVATAGSAMMKNRYVFTGVTWASSALNSIVKAAGEVEQKTKEKVIAGELLTRSSQGYSPMDDASASDDAATIHHTSHP